MDPTEDDDALLGLFVQKCAARDSEPLKRRIQELEQQVQDLIAELKLTFEKVDQQATTIRRYRAVLKQALENDVPLQPMLPPQPIPPVRTIEAAPIQPPPRAIEVEPSAPKRFRLAEPSTQSAQPCGEMIAEKKIRRPTQERSDGYAEITTGQTIWSVIVEFFNSNPNASLMSETMLIRHAGNLLLGDATKPYLDSKMIHRYFSHPFTCTDQDETMTVRTRMVEDKQVWYVFIPEWLKAKWRAG